MAGQRQEGGAKSAPATDIYHVRGPGSLMRTVEADGKKTRVAAMPGELVELTPQEAEELGDLVVQGEPPSPPTPPEKRSAGLFLVVGPGAVKCRDQNDADGSSKFYPAGSVVKLTREDARSLGEQIVEAKG